MSIQHMFRRCLRRVGFDLRKVRPGYSEFSALVRQMDERRVDVIFDVGANAGQFACKLREAGYSRKIVSFEPSSAAHAKLTRRRRDAKWIVAPRMALGDRDGTANLNIAGNSESSSMLPILSSHLDADPSSQYIGSEAVDLRRLDTVGRQFVEKDDRVFLKLDVQGFESSVLRGSEQFQSQVIGIQLELSFVPLYAGESLFHPMLHELEDRGYELWSIVPGFADPETSRVLQVDGLFFRSVPNQPHREVSARELTTLGVGGFADARKGA